MSIKRIRAIVAEAARTKRAAREQGRHLEEAFAELLQQIAPGQEDPVLLHLAGDDLADRARRTKWSTLVINPGSTSTKVAVYSGLTLVAEEEVNVNPGEGDGVAERAHTIERWVQKRGLDFANLTGIAARGGFVAPLPMATYRISEEMCDDLKNAPHRHASNMAVPMAIALGRLAGPDVVLTITDPVTCDDIESVYRITGSPKIRTDGTGAHYLNMRAVYTLAARLLGADPTNLHLVTCHMGGGMSAARFRGGRIVQVLPAFGSFPSANRSGNLPLKELIRLVDERNYDFDDLKADVVEGKGGLLGLTGTQDFRKLFAFADRADSQQKAKIDLIVTFYANRVAAGIMELAATTEPLDGIVLTGGLANHQAFCEMVADRIPLSVPITRVPGSLESPSLAAGSFRAAADPISRHNYAEARDALAQKRAEEDALFNIQIFETNAPIRGDTRLDTLDKIVAAARGLEQIPTVALVGADNEEALLAAKLANPVETPPMARFVLLGAFAKISDLAWELDIPIDEETYFIVDTSDPVGRAMELYREGVVDTVMKGSVSTAAMLRGYLKTVKEMGRLKKDAVLSHVGLCELPHKDSIVAVTDAAINPDPDVKTRAVILENALTLLRRLGFVTPKVAVIAPTEKTSEKVASTMAGEALEQMYTGREDVIVEGPISVDLALSKESATDKRYSGKIQGDADILLVPNLDVGNAVYKSFTITGEATVGGVVVGCGTPFILTSRGDSSQTKFASIALALVLAKRGGVQ